TWPGHPDMAKLESLLAQAERPIVILGGSRWSEQARATVMQVAEKWSLPVATSYRRLPLFDPMHPCYAGDLGLGPNPKLAARVKASDLVILLGGRLGDIPSQGYTLLDIPGPHTKLVHIHPGAEELGRVYTPYLAINAAPAAFVQMALAMTPPSAIKWREETTTAHA